MQGKIQLQNSALAIVALLCLRERGWEISDAAIVNGIANTRWPGRLQWFTWRGHKILIDGAHNPASAEVLREFVDSLLGRQRTAGSGQKAEEDAETRRHRNAENSIQNSKLKTQNSFPTPYSPLPTPLPTHWVMGMLSTKDHADVFKALLRGGDRLYLIPVPDHSSAIPEQLAAIAQEVCPDLAECQTFPDVITALEAAIAENLPKREDTSDKQLTVLCGSLYLIGHFFKLTNRLE